MKKTQVEYESRVISGAHGVAAEEDHLILSKVISVGVVSLAIFAVGILWAWRLQVTAERDLQPDGPPPVPAAIGQYEIGIVNQRLFEQDWHAEQKRSQQELALRNGTGDKPGVKTHLTIEEAMDRVIAEAQQPPPPPPTPPVPPAPASNPPKP